LVDALTAPPFSPDLRMRNEFLKKTAAVFAEKYWQTAGIELSTTQRRATPVVYMCERCTRRRDGRGRTRASYQELWFARSG
jgi:hypothetical protein